MAGVSYELVILIYWWVLFVVASFIAVGLELKKKLRQRPAPSLEYVKARLYVQRWLQKRCSNGKTRLDHILYLLSEYICKVLENEDNKKEKEDEIKRTIGVLRGKAQHTELKHALLFEMTMQIQPNNVDPIQLRRSANMQRIIKETFEKLQDRTNDKRSCCCCSCICCYCFCQRSKTLLNAVSGMFWKMIGRISSLLWFVDPKFWVKLLICLPIGCGLVFYVIDYGTDFKILALYSCQFITFIHPNGSICDLLFDHSHSTYTLPEDWDLLNLNDTLTTKDSLMLLRRNIAYNFLSSSVVICFVLFVSLFGIPSSIRSVRYLYRYKQYMQDPDNERICEKAVHEKAVHRLDLSILESTFEAGLQFVVQASTYFANAWLLTWMQTELTTSADTQDPLQFSDLWLSILMSLLSQSVGRFKRRSLLHEDSDGNVQKILFLSYSLLQTLFVSLLMVNLTTSVYDRLTMAQLENLYSGHKGGLVELVMVYANTSIYAYISIYAFFYIFFLSIVFFVTATLRLPTNQDILTTNSPTYEKRARLKTIACLSLCTASWNTHGYLESANAGHNLSKFESIFTGQNVTDDSSISLYEATPNNNRKVFALMYMILMPVCWMGAELFLWLYFQSSSLHMEFTQEEKKLADLSFTQKIFLRFDGYKEQLKNVLPNVPSGGIWLDLNTDPEGDPKEIEKFVQQFARTEDIGVEVNIENETNTVEREEISHEDLDSTSDEEESSTEVGNGVKLSISAGSKERWDQVKTREDIKYSSASKEEGLERKHEVKANEIEMTNVAVCEGTSLMAENLIQENNMKEEREDGDVDDQDVSEIMEDEKFDKLKEIQRSFAYWRFQ